MQDLIKFDTTNSNLVNVANKSGSTTLRLQTAKEFKTAYKLSNPKASAKQQSEAFTSYVRAESSKLANGFDFQRAIALAAEGKLGIRKVGVNKKGDASTVVFLDLSANGPSLDKVTENAVTLPAAQMRELLERLKVELAKTEVTKSETLSDLLNK